MATYLDHNIYGSPKAVTIDLECMYCASSHTLPCELVTNASTSFIGELLHYDNHAIAYEYRHMNDAKHKYGVCEQYLSAIVYRLCEWIC